MYRFKLVSTIILDETITFDIKIPIEKQVTKKEDIKN
jgi:hypothetical protein